MQITEQCVIITYRYIVCTVHKILYMYMHIIIIAQVFINRKLIEYHNIICDDACIIIIL